MTREIKYRRKTYTVLFPDLIRPLAPREVSTLTHSIASCGVLVAVVVDEDGGIIDGANRLRIAVQAGKDVPFDVRPGLSFEEKLDLAYQLNDARRHMSVKDKRLAKKHRAELVKGLSAKGMSSRDIAKELGVTQPTVLADLESATGEGENMFSPDLVANGTAEKPPESESEPDTAPVAVDSLGVPIRDHAAAAFKAAPLFDELLTLLRRADRLYSQLAEHPGGAYLLRPGISVNARERWKHRGIGDAIKALEDCKPALTFCPNEYRAAAFPEGRYVHGDDCALCRGLRWFRAYGKNEVPAELLAKAREEAGV